MTGSESQTKVQFFNSHVFPILVLWPDPIDAGIYAVLLVFTALITIFPLDNELLGGNVEIADDKKYPLVDGIETFEPAPTIFP